MITHETHTTEQLQAARANARADHARLAREHGTYYTLTPAGGPAVSGRYDYSSALNRLTVEIDRLEYEIKCAEALARSGFAVGDRVRVGPPRQPFAHAAGLGPEYGHDACTGAVGRVTGISSDGSDLRIAFDGRDDYDSAPISRCTKL